MKRHLPLIALLTLAMALPVAAQVVVAPRIQVHVNGTWIGVSVLDVTEDRVKELKLKEERGVEVVTVAGDGPAQKAGLKEHDVILEYNGTRVEGVDQFKRMVSETPAGRSAKLQISRDGVTQTLSVKIEERASTLRHGSDGNANSWAFSMPPLPSLPSPPAPPRTPRALIPGWNGDLGSFLDGFGFWDDSPRLGIEGEEIGGQLGEYFGVPESKGVLVREVTAGSAAEKAGLKAGDVITKVSGKPVRTMSDLREAIRDGAGKSVQRGTVCNDCKRDLSLTVIRNKKEINLNVTVEHAENRSGDRV
jgi:S1-C subfamily serine protease